MLPLTDGDDSVERGGGGKGRGGKKCLLLFLVLMSIVATVFGSPIISEDFAIDIPVVRPWEEYIQHVRPTASNEEQEAAVLELLQRLLPDRNTEFSVTVDPTIGPAGKDTFIVTSPGVKAKVDIKGTSGVAASWGLLHYLKYTCNAHISWEADQLSSLPTILPEAQINVTSNDKFRYYQNVCTVSYSFAWWNWTRWEREIDWMAMNGINIPLAFTGQEAIWQRVYLKLGVTQEELDEHFTGPAFFAWERMGNFRKFGGPLSAAWHNQTLALQHQILQRMRQFGMTPILPAFAGHVPAGLARVFPDAKITRLGEWAGFNCSYSCTYLLDPNDPLFKTIGSDFINELTTEFGTDHMYNCDTFNEMSPASSDPAYLKSVGEAVFGAMTTADPNAIWVMQGWLFLSSFWQKPQAQALLTSVPIGRMLVLDLASESAPQYSRLESYFGQPFIFCMLHDYGGVNGLFGNVDRLLEHWVDAKQFPNVSMAGTGLTPEGINQNYVMYDLMNELAWRTQPPNVTSWAVSYASRRYGSNDTRLGEAWQLLIGSVYQNGSGGGNILIYRPDVTKTGDHIWYSVADVVKAWDLIIDVIQESNKDATTDLDAESNGIEEKQDIGGKGEPEEVAGEGLGEEKEVGGNEEANKVAGEGGEEAVKGRVEVENEETVEGVVEKEEAEKGLAEKAGEEVIEEITENGVAVEEKAEEGVVDEKIGKGIAEEKEVVMEEKAEAIILEEKTEAIILEEKAEAKIVEEEAEEGVEEKGRVENGMVAEEEVEEGIVEEENENEGVVEEKTGEGIVEEEGIGREVREEAEVDAKKGIRVEEEARGKEAVRIEEGETEALKESDGYSEMVMVVVDIQYSDYEEDENLDNDDDNCQGINVDDVIQELMMMNVHDDDEEEEEIVDKVIDDDDDNRDEKDDDDDDDEKAIDDDDDDDDDEKAVDGDDDENRNERDGDDEEEKQKIQKIEQKEDEKEEENRDEKKKKNKNKKKEETKNNKKMDNNNHNSILSPLPESPHLGNPTEQHFIKSVAALKDLQSPLDLDLEESANSVLSPDLTPVHSKQDNTQFGGQLRSPSQVKLTVTEQATFQHDVVDVTRQILQILGGQIVLRMIHYYNTGNATGVKSDSETIQMILNDMDQLLGTSPDFLVGAWTKSAADWATNEQEREQYVYNALNQITIWGPGHNDNILDYALKQWSGVVGNYIAPRWDLFASQLMDSLEKGQPFNQSVFNSDVYDQVEEPFTMKVNASFPSEPSGDVMAMATLLHQKYRPYFNPSLLDTMEHQRQSYDSLVELETWKYPPPYVGPDPTVRRKTSWAKKELPEGKLINILRKEGLERHENSIWNIS